MKFTFSPHIALQVKSYQNACRFYKNVLGFKLVQSKNKETHFNIDGMNLYIEDGEDQQATFFEFKVDSVAEAIALLEGENCKVLERYSEKNVMIQDPYGMNFHIWEDGAIF
jgi:catechol 2,3-dioxygenase-like lactoylglutathione lyase family enzyme